MVSSSLGTLSFAQDENGNWGYRVGGADSVIPFKSKLFDSTKIKVTASRYYSGGYYIPLKLYLDDVEVGSLTASGTDYGTTSVKYSSSDDYKNNYVIRYDFVRHHNGSYCWKLNIYINDNLVESKEFTEQDNTVTLEFNVNN